MADSAEDYALRRALGQANLPQTILGRNPDTILIKNGSEAARDRLDVLALDGPLILPSTDEPEFYRQPVFSGITPQAITDGTTHVGQWALLLEPAAAGATVRAAVGGTWACIVYASHPDQKWCDIAHDSHALTSNWYGRGQILWHEKWDDEEFDAGEGKAIVHLGNFHSETIEGKIASGTIAAGGSGTVNVWIDGTVTDPLIAIPDVAYRWITLSTLTTSLFLRLRYNRKFHRWEVYDHNCAS